MPFKESKRDKNHRYYVAHTDKVKAKARQRYAGDREVINARNGQYGRDRARMNPSRTRESNSRTARTRYHSSISKSRASTRKRVATHYNRDVTQSRVCSKVRVSKHYYKNIHRSRVMSCTSTARQYMRDVDRSRAKARCKSRGYFLKMAAEIKRRKRDRYSLAKPKENVLACLENHFRGGFVQNKSAVQAIISGLHDLADCTIPSGSGRAFRYAVCKRAASHLIQVSLEARRQAVRTLLEAKRCIMDLELTGISDFGERKHYTCWEPYYHDAAYSSHVGRAGKIPPIAVKEDGSGEVSDVKSSVSVVRNKEGKVIRTTLSWDCSPRCKPLSKCEVDSIVALKEMFDADMAPFLKALDACDDCPYVHSYKQEWQQSSQGKPVSDEEGESAPKIDPDVNGKPQFTPRLRLGHPLVCHLPGSKCRSPIRILRAAVVHFSKLSRFQRRVCQARTAFRRIKDIDSGIQNREYSVLLVACDLTLDSMFKDGPLNASCDSGDVGDLQTPFRVEHLETNLLLTHAKLIQKYERKVHDYAINPCISCDQLFRRDQVTIVNVAQLRKHDVFVQLEAATVTNSSDQPVYICKHCKSAISRDVMPGRCILNGLQTKPLPDELKGLDPFSLQLIQLAKAFQTVIRLKTYSNKVPSWNCLQACKGNMFVLPLPLNKTAETLRVSESGLPKPELYVMMDGAPTKKKVIWRTIVNIQRVQAALSTLKQINWLYSEVKPDKIEKSMEDLVIAVANSATCTMVEKVGDKQEYVAGLQAYTIRSLDKSIPVNSDIDQYRMVNIAEYPLKGTQEHLDLMCFPDLFPTGEFGQHHERQVSLGFSEYVKSRLCNRDSRFRRKAEYIFFLMHQKMDRELKAGIYNCLKNTRQRQSSVCELLTRLESNDNELEGNLSTILQSVRGTRQYWNKRRGELNCMIRDFGPPTLFLTLSCAEYRSADITEYLKLVNGYEASSNPDIGTLCTKDPVSVSIQFSHKFHAFFNEVIIKGEVLGKVSNYYWKKEYQARGAPHYHILLWIEGAPVIGENTSTEVMSWIQERITCHIPDARTDKELYHLVTSYQVHKCTNSCLRSRKVGDHYIRRCRYCFPREPTDQGRINPIDPSLKTRQKIYYLPRKPEEARVNDYNPLLLLLWKANMDLQFIAESSMTLTQYVSSYVTKAEKSCLQDMWTEIAGCGSIYSKLWKFALKAMKSREVGLYEATDLLLGDHLTEKSCTVQWVNARLPNKRTRCLKPYRQLQELGEMQPSSNDVYMASVIDVHYPKRPQRLSTMCLYDFVSKVDYYHRDPKSGDRTYRLLQKPRVVNHPFHDPDRPEQEDDYYYSLVLLFVPFVDEDELLEPGETPKDAFGRLQNDDALAHHEKLQKMLAASYKKKKIDEAREALDPPKEREGEEDEDVHVLQGSARSDLDTLLNLDQDIDPLDLDSRVSMLNADQMRVYTTVTHHLLHQSRHDRSECHCTQLKPLHMFVSGVGGTGKSFLIQAIRQFTKVTWPDAPNVSAVAAPTGLAACNVGGVTTYQLFQLPIEHDSKTAQYWPLPKASLKILRHQLHHVKLFIIDEVSMVSSLNLAYIHLRLEEIFGGDCWFGGKSVVFVGDILQLPPVNGTPVFRNVPSKTLSLRLGCLGALNIWKECVVYDELTINERQKADKEYTTLLDGIRRGFPSTEAINQLGSRVFTESAIDKYTQLATLGKAPICLFPTRKACADLNTQLLATLDTDTVELPSIDEIDEGAATNKWNQRASERLKKLNEDSNMTAGLEAILRLAKGCRVMLRRNLSTEQGLVNGAVGTVLDVSARCSCVMVKFDNIEQPFPVNRVKSRFCVLKQFYVHRQQFPLMVSYAVTIHKSQGLSLDSAIIDLSDNVFADGMAYVALSRVRSISGVHLTAFSRNSIMASRDGVEEVNRLRETYTKLDLYDVPPAKPKRKLTTAILPGQPKKLRKGALTPVTRGVKRKQPGFSEPCSKVPKQAFKYSPFKTGMKSGLSDQKPRISALTADSAKAKVSSGKSDRSSSPDLILVDVGVSPLRSTMRYYPLDVQGQQRTCAVLNLIYRGPSGVSLGGPNVPLTSPDTTRLVDTLPDGNCMFRAFSILLTGTQCQHRELRNAIVQYLRDKEHMFVHNPRIFDCADYPTMEAYITARGMTSNGWGSQVELHALAMMLGRRVYTFHSGRDTTRGWIANCPSHVDPTIIPPHQEQGLYLFHTGNHYLVVTSVR